MQRKVELRVEGRSKDAGGYKCGLPASSILLPGKTYVTVWVEDAAGGRLLGPALYRVPGGTSYMALCLGDGTEGEAGASVQVEVTTKKKGVRRVVGAGSIPLADLHDGSSQALKLGKVSQQSSSAEGNFSCVAQIVSAAPACKTRTKRPRLDSVAFYLRRRLAYLADNVGSVTGFSTGAGIHISYPMAAL